VTSSEHISYRFTGMHASQAPEAGTMPALANTANPDPPSLTASWGAAPNLWIAVASNVAAASISSYPANYTDNQLNPINGTVGSIGVATRNLSLATEDPGVFTNSSSANCSAQTIVVRGLPGAPVLLPSSFQHMLVR
jgi:hypothetical protein